MKKDSSYGLPSQWLGREKLSAAEARSRALRRLKELAKEHRAKSGELDGRLEPESRVELLVESGCVEDVGQQQVAGTEPGSLGTRGETEDERRWKDVRLRNPRS